jgi:hypothetical protein
MWVNTKRSSNLKLPKMASASIWKIKLLPDALRSQFGKSNCFLTLSKATLENQIDSGAFLAVFCEEGILSGRFLSIPPGLYFYTSTRQVLLFKCWLRWFREG